MDFSNTSVLCVGDVMLDEFMSGSIDRISPEAPVPVLRLTETRTMLGGAGNVARNIAALGGNAVLVGLVGQDANVERLRQLVAMTPRLIDATVGSPLRPTTRKSRFSAVHQQVLRVDEEFTLPARPSEVELLKARIGERMSGVQAVILSDYRKGVLTPEIVRFAIAQARARDIPVFVDPKSKDFSKYRGATCITPNLAELAAAGGRPAEEEAEIVALAREFLVKAKAEAILVTRSASGMTLVQASGEVRSVQARALEVFDVSGAGDTAIATFALAYASGETMARAMEIANAAAGIVVGKLGTATVNPDELARAVDDDEDRNAGPNATLLDLGSAVALVDRWKRRGLTVGFTNGCFDILHAGHVSLLAQARAQCSRLIVGLNTDDSVRRLKGADRPLNALSDRAAVLTGMRYVDGVVAFREETPSALVELLRPDVLIKGADYRLEEVAGADVVRANGGRVVLAEFVSERSTTRLVQAIQAMRAQRPSATTRHVDEKETA